MSDSDKSRKRRCPKCGGWTIGNTYYCSSCNAVMDPQREENKLKLIAQLRKKREAIAMEASQPPFKRVMLKIGRIAEAIYMAIVSFIAWVLFLLAG